jgi:Cu/Ag efflux pump CusA
MKTINEAVKNLSREDLEQLATTKLKEMQNNTLELIWKINCNPQNNLYQLEYETQREQMKRYGLYDNKNDRLYDKAIKGELISR